MGWLSGLARQKPEARAMLVTPADLAEMLAEQRSVTGRIVGPEKALQQVTVFACVRLIATSVGMLRPILYRRLERGKERATNHPLYSVLHDLPNPELTAAELGENVAGHLALWGNAFLEIEYDMAMRRRALWLLRPDQMEVTVNDRNERVYVYTLPNGEPKALARWRVWHVRGWGTDAWVGRSPIMLAREAIGLALATEEYGGRFFGNDSRPGGILKTPNKLTDAAAEKLKLRWESAHRGLTNAQRVAVLEDGLEWQQIGIPPGDAQFLETRKYQDTQICSLYGVPPHMIGITDRSTSWGTGIGQQTQGFVTFAIGSYLQRISQSAYRDLLSTPERKEYLIEYLSAALVQNDLAARYNAYNIGRMGGWLSVNDIREAENMNPVPDGDGYLQPLNMAPLGSEPAAAEPAEPDRTEGDDDAASD